MILFLRSPIVLEIRVSSALLLQGGKAKFGTNFKFRKDRIIQSRQTSFDPTNKIENSQKRSKSIPGITLVSGDTGNFFHNMKILLKF